MRHLVLALLFASPVCAQDIVVGAEEIEILNIHRGIWEDVEDCTGIEADINDATFYVARLIISNEGFLAYGMTVFDDDKPVAIIFDRMYWLHPSTISHEAEHFIRASWNEGDIECEMPVPSETGLRILHPDSLAYYRSRIKKTPGP